MKKGKILSRKIENEIGTKGDFSVSFDNQEFGPYDYIFTKKNLYFSEKINDRGAATFPLREKRFDTTEIFLEHDDIIIGVGKRGSISGDIQNFIDIINIETGKKNRFFTDEVQLIYNGENTLEVFLKNEGKNIHYSLDIQSLKEIEKQQEEISTFFKLIYNWEKKSYENLVFQNPIGGENTGFFERKNIEQKEKDTESIEPNYFVRQVFTVGTKSGMIDAWESTLYNSIRFSD